MAISSFIKWERFLLMVQWSLNSPSTLLYLWTVSEWSHGTFANAWEWRMEV